MDLDTLDRLINEACLQPSSSPKSTVRRSIRRRSLSPSSRRSSLNLNLSASSQSSPSGKNVMTFSCPPLVVGERKHSSCEHSHSIVMLFLKMMMMMAIIKLIKPDFGVKTSHAHGQGRFLRANNVLLNDSPFRPRFIEEVYHRVDNDVKEEDSRR